MNKNININNDILENKIDKENVFSLNNGSSNSKEQIISVSFRSL